MNVKTSCDRHRHVVALVNAGSRSSLLRHIHHYWVTLSRLSLHVTFITGESSCCDNHCTSRSCVRRGTSRNCVNHCTSRSLAHHCTSRSCVNHCTSLSCAHHCTSRSCAHHCTSRSCVNHCTSRSCSQHCTSRSCAQHCTSRSCAQHCTSRCCLPSRCDHHVVAVVPLWPFDGAITTAGVRGWLCVVVDMKQKQSGAVSVCNRV